MKFKQGRYRHRLCLDMDVQILKVTYRGPSYVTAKVLYLERKTGNPYVSQTQTVRLLKEHWGMWERIS